MTISGVTVLAAMVGQICHIGAADLEDHPDAEKICVSAMLDCVKDKTKDPKVKLGQAFDQCVKDTGLEKLILARGAAQI